MKLAKTIYTDHPKIDTVNNEANVVMNITDESTFAQVLHYQHELKILSDSFKARIELAAINVAVELLQGMNKCNSPNIGLTTHRIMFLTLVSDIINEVAKRSKIPQSIEFCKKLYNEKRTLLDKLNNDKAALFIQNKTYPQRQPFSIFSDKPIANQLEISTNNTSLDGTDGISDHDIANSTFGQSSNIALKFRNQRR